jgi:RNA polymerase sigma factor (sigma-70 family)
MKHPDETLDTALLDRARGGDADAIAELIHRYQPDLKKFADGVCQTSEDAEDAVQHALFVVSSKLGLFRGVSKFSTWLFAVVKYECYRLMRRMRGQVVLEDTHVDPRKGPDEKVEQDDLMAKVLGAVRKLDADQREVFLLRDVEGLSASDVAARLDLSLAAMKSRLHRARLFVKASVTG